MVENTQGLAIVSGASKGIGKAIVEKLAAQGWAVAYSARGQAGLEALKTEVLAQHPQAQLFPFVADMGQRQAVEAFADYVKTLGTPDILVNNAGFFLPGSIHTEAEGTFEAMLQTNLHSAYYLTRALLPGMIARQSGHVFNICSTASITAYTNGGSYCISKFALLGFNKVLRQELIPHRIRVTAFLPGATLTDSWAGADLPAERFMRPEDIAELLWSVYQMPLGTVVEEVLLRPLEGDI